MKRTPCKFLAVAVVALIIAGGVQAKETAPTPDPELLEFLGTFEKDGYSGIDPYISGKPGAPENRAPAGAEKNKDRQPHRKETIGEKESTDE
jgi:hypothetical protein